MFHWERQSQIIKSSSFLLFFYLSYSFLSFFSSIFFTFFSDTFMFPLNSHLSIAHTTLAILPHLFFPPTDQKAQVILPEGVLECSRPYRLGHLSLLHRLQRVPLLGRQRPHDHPAPQPRGLHRLRLHQLLAGRLQLRPRHHGLLRLDQGALIRYDFF